MTDGLLDVVLLRPVPRLKLPGLLGSYKKGEHLSEGDTVTEKFAPYMTFFRTGSIDIEVLDGNPLITTLDGECSPRCGCTRRSRTVRCASCCRRSLPQTQTRRLFCRLWESKNV